MALLTELFGQEVISRSLDDIKALLRGLQPASQQDKELMLKEFAFIRGIELTAQDFEDIK